MQCKFDHYLLQDYLDGLIEPLEKIILEEHLKVCPACRRELTELKLLLWEFENLNEIEMPREVSSLRTQVLNDLMADGTAQPFGVKQFISLQRKILDTSGSFVNLVPGVRPSISAVEKTVKKIPGAASKFFTTLSKRNSSGLIRGRL